MKPRGAKGFIKFIIQLISNTFFKEKYLLEKRNRNSNQCLLCISHHVRIF